MNQSMDVFQTPHGHHARMMAPLRGTLVPPKGQGTGEAAMWRLDADVQPVTGRMAEGLLQALAAAGAVRGTDALKHLVGTLAVHLGMKWAHVATLVPGKRELRVRALCIDGKVRKGCVYAMKEAPCAFLSFEERVSYAGNLRQRFPGNATLKAHDLSSYHAVRLLDGPGKPVGVLAVMDPKPRELDDDGWALMRLAAVLASWDLELERLKEELTHRERLDLTTGVLRKEVFMEEAAQVFATAGRYGRPLSMVVVDVDQMRRFNQQWGYEAGDRMLAHVADTLKDAAREMDLVGRVDGDAFAMLMPETDLDGGWAAASRLQEAVRTSSIPSINGPVRVTVSIGVVPMGKDTGDVGALLSQAEEVLTGRRAGRR